MDASQNHWQKGEKAPLFATLLLGKTSDSQALGTLSGKNFWVGGGQLSSVTFGMCR